jgi:hypothetical protein
MKPILPICFIALGFTLGLLATLRCRMFVFHQTPDAGGSEVFVGMFRYETTFVAATESYIWVSDVCVRYDNLQTATGPFDYTLDSKAEAMQSLSIAVSVIGGLFMILACIAPCASFGPKMWKGTAVIIVITCIMQGCTLMVQSSSLCYDNPVIQFLEEYYPAVYSTLENPTSCEWVRRLLTKCADGMEALFFHRKYLERTFSSSSFCFILTTTSQASEFKLGISAVAFWGIGGLMMLAIGPEQTQED